jgi:hypothetical protein
VNVAEGEQLHGPQSATVAAPSSFGAATEGDQGITMTTMPETEYPGQPEEADPPEPDEDDARQGDRGPEPEDPIPAEAPEVPAGEPKEG